MILSYQHTFLAHALRASIYSREVYPTGHSRAPVVAAIPALTVPTRALLADEESLYESPLGVIDRKVYLPARWQVVLNVNSSAKRVGNRAQQ